MYKVGDIVYARPIDIRGKFKKRVRVKITQIVKQGPFNPLNTEYIFKADFIDEPIFSGVSAGIKLPSVLEKIQYFKDWTFRAEDIEFTMYDLMEKQINEAS